MITLQDLITETLNIFESEDIKQLEKERMRLYMKVKNWKKSGKDTSELEKQLNDAKKRLSDAKKAARLASKGAVVTPQQSTPSGDDSLFGDLGTAGFGSLDIDSLMNDKTTDEKLIKDNIEQFLKDNFNIREIDINTRIKIVKKKDTFVVNGLKSMMRIIIFNKDITSLTNGMFEWGKCSCVFEVKDCHKLTDLTGSPKSCEHFYCENCNSLTSLKGAPQEANTFRCSSCANLKTLEGAPQECEYFYCSECNSLTSLKGAPISCGHFYCNYCDNLVSLEGAPENCMALFCERCKKLKSLKGCPDKLYKLFCSFSNITSFKGGPTHCSSVSANNTNIKDLYGLPENLITLQVSACDSLESFEGCPQKLKFLVCKNCPKLKSIKGCPPNATIDASYSPIKDIVPKNKPQ